MKCPHCFAMCADSDLVCHGCKQMIRREEAPPAKVPFAYRIAMIGACLGACILPLVVHPSGAHKASQGINMGAAVLAGLGGMVGGTLGLAIGSLLSVLFRSKNS